MRYLIARVACAVVGHRYRVLRRFSHGTRKVGCDRCKRAWGMHDATRSFVPWDGDLEELFRPGGLLNPEGDS